MLPPQLTRRAYARVFWETESSNLHLTVYLVPHDLPNLRKSGVQPEENDRSTSRAALHRLFKQLFVHDQPLLNQVRSSGTLLHAWNAIQSPPSRADLQGLDEHTWLKAIINELYTKKRPFGLDKTLFPYQRNDVAALLCAEGLPRMADDVTFQPLIDESGTKFWTNVDFQLKKRVGRYPMPTGGICANMPGSGKSLELLSLIAATKNRIAPLKTEMTGYGPFVPELQIKVPSSAPSRNSTAPVVRSLLESCVKVIRVKLALDLEDINQVVDTSAAPLLAHTEFTFHRPSPELFLNHAEPWHRSSSRINSDFHVRELKDFATSTMWASKTTLLVVPANLIQHWEEEIRSGIANTISYQEAKKRFQGRAMCDWTSAERLAVEGQFLWTTIKDADHKKGLMEPKDLAKFDLILMSNLVFQKRTGALRTLPIAER